MRPTRTPPRKAGSPELTVQQTDLKVQQTNLSIPSAADETTRAHSTSAARLRPTRLPPSRNQDVPAPVSPDAGEQHQDLQPWVHVPAGTHLGHLSAPEQRVHDLLRAWRALRLVDLLQATTPQLLRSLMARHEIYLHPTLLGPCVILGPMGRVRAGKRADNRPSTNSVMDDAYMAHAVSLLVAEHGWQFLERRKKRYLMDTAEGHTCVVIGQSRGHTARSLRRIVKPLLFEAARDDLHVLIVTPDRRRTMSTEGKSSRIQVMHLRMLRHIQRRALREQNDLLEQAEKRRATQRTA